MSSSFPLLEARRLLMERMLPQAREWYPHLLCAEGNVYFSSGLAGSRSLLIINERVISSYLAARADTPALDSEGTNHYLVRDGVRRVRVARSEPTIDEELERIMSLCAAARHGTLPLVRRSYNRQEAERMLDCCAVASRNTFPLRRPRYQGGIVDPLATKYEACSETHCYGTFLSNNFVDFARVQRGEEAISTMSMCMSNTNPFSHRVFIRDSEGCLIAVLEGETLDTRKRPSALGPL